MAEVCKNGHELTEENSLWHKDHGRGRLRRRCKECKNEYRRSGTPNAAAVSIQATDDRLEDIDDLIRFGATYKEILERGPYASWDTMYRGLKRRGRQDLIDAIRNKKAAV